MSSRARTVSPSQDQQDKSGEQSFSNRVPSRSDMTSLSRTESKDPNPDNALSPGSTELDQGTDPKEAPLPNEEDNNSPASHTSPFLVHRKLSTATPHSLQSMVLPSLLSSPTLTPRVVMEESFTDDGEPRTQIDKPLQTSPWPDLSTSVQPKDPFENIFTFDNIPADEYAIDDFEITLPVEEKKETEEDVVISKGFEIKPREPSYAKQPTYWLDIASLVIDQDLTSGYKWIAFYLDWFGSHQMSTFEDNTFSSPSDDTYSTLSCSDQVEKSFLGYSEDLDLAVVHRNRVAYKTANELRQKARQKKLQQRSPKLERVSRKKNRRKSAGSSMSSTADESSFPRTGISDFSSDSDSERESSTYFVNRRKTNRPFEAHRRSSASCTDIRESKCIPSLKARSASRIPELAPDFQQQELIQAYLQETKLLKKKKWRLSFRLSRRESPVLTLYVFV